MPIGEYTLINIDFDLFLVVTNLVCNLLVAAGSVALVFATRKMGQKLRGSVYWVVLSLVTASFFKSYVFEFFTHLISNLALILCYAYVFFSKRFYQQLLNLLLYAALVACPFMFRLITGLFQGRPTRTDAPAEVKFTQMGSKLLTGTFSRPSFHFIS